MDAHTREQNHEKALLPENIRIRTETETTTAEKIQPWKLYFDQPVIPDVPEGDDPRIRIEREKDAPDGLGG
jgi:hypothetical protein